MDAADVKRLKALELENSRLKKLLAEAALDIVQDSMMKLAEHYGDKPPTELPMLFQRILSNCTLDVPSWYPS